MSRSAKWASGLVAVAGVMGLSGVMIAAAGVHLAGGELARTAAEFLLVHAAVVFAASRPTGPAAPSVGLLTAATVLALSASVFSCDLAFAALEQLHPIPLAAPVGGIGMIVGWLLIAAVGCRELFLRR